MNRINKLVDVKKDNNPNKMIVGTITPSGNQGYFYTKLSNYLYRILDKISNNKYQFYYYQQNNIKKLIQSVDEAKIVFFDTYSSCDTVGALDEQMTNIKLSSQKELFDLLNAYSNINVLYTTSEEATVCLRKVIQNIDYYSKERTSMKKAEEQLYSNLNRKIEIIKLYSPARYAINRLGGGQQGIENAANKWMQKGFNI